MSGFWVIAAFLCCIPHLPEIISTFNWRRTGLIRYERGRGAPARGKLGGGRVSVRGNGNGNGGVCGDGGVVVRSNGIIVLSGDHSPCN